MRPEARTSNQIWILADYLEFGSLHHPNSCMINHRTAAPAAILMVPSIKIPSKCAISSFSFSHLSCIIYASRIYLSRARATFFPLFQPFIPKEAQEIPARARCLKSHQTNPQKWRSSAEFGVCDLTFVPAGARCPRPLIHRLSPATICRWSLEFVT